MMKSGRVRGLLNLVTVSLMFVLAALSAKAQQTTGVPCSPSATTTVDGKYVPPPAPGFGGTINLSATDSKPCWPPKIVPPKGAPNVLLIMTDDQGYGITSTFGGVIPTPAMDRLAKAGLRYTQFHSTALCSPTRGSDHRPQPPLCGLRRDCGAGYGISRIRFDHRQEQRHRRRDSSGERLCDIVVRQKP